MHTFGFDFTTAAAGLLEKYLLMLLIFCSAFSLSSSRFLFAFRGNQ
jgi:hypothetical protein